MDLTSMLTDSAYVEKPTGQRLGPFKTRFGSQELVFHDPKFSGEEGDFIVQSLPGDRELKHQIVDVQYHAGLVSIPASWIVTVRRAGAIAQAHSVVTTNYNVNATNVQVGNHNSQQITATFQTLVEQIDASGFPDAEKREAKSRLKQFLENPVTLAVLGGAAQGLFGLLS